MELGLKSFIFTKADDANCIYLERPAPIPTEEGVEFIQEDPAVVLKRCKDEQTSRKQREAAGSIAFLVIGAPLFWFFYREARS